MSDLSQENRLYVSQAVEAGIYPNPEAALDEAVSLLRMRDQLRADVQLGIDQADRGELLPAEEVFQRLERRVDETSNLSRRR